MLLEVRYVCEKWRRFHGNHCATLGRQFAQLRVSTFIDVAHISCTHQPPANLFSCVFIWLHVLPHLELVAYFATLATGGMFYRICSC